MFSQVARTFCGAGVVETDAGRRLVVGGGSTGVVASNGTGSAWNTNGSAWNTNSGSAWNGANQTQTFLDSCEFYDPAAQEWTLMKAK